MFVRFFSFVPNSLLVSLKVIELANKTTETSVHLWAGDGFRESWSSKHWII
jgi:hypothetical protein